MDTRIPYEFLRRHATLGWRDLEYGIAHGWTSYQAAVEKAIDRLDEKSSRDEYDLSMADDDEDVSATIARLSNTESVDLIASESKWLYLRLAWLFVNKDRVEDPLEAVESLYAQFNYPTVVAPLVRWMPMVGDDLGSREKNLKRIYERWRHYLNASAQLFGGSEAF